MSQEIWGCQRLGSSHSSFAGNTLHSIRTCRLAAPCRLQVLAATIGPGKKWEHYELNKNKNVVRIPMHVKKGDTVQVIAGYEKGQVGEVKEVLTKVGKVVVTGVNMRYKRQRPANKGDEPETIVKEYPIQHSNVMHYSKEKEVRSRIGHKFLEDGSKVRYLKKTGEVID